MDARAEESRQGPASKSAGTSALYQVLGARIRSLRVSARMTMAELGSLLGVTHQQIHKYERGQNRISVSTLLALARALGVSPRDILEGIEHL